MTSDHYYSVSKNSNGNFKDRGSKFLGFAFPVASENEVKNIIRDLKKEYYDARHHCYAYVIGTQGEEFRASDDGEPSHSAGDPILGQIRSRNLTHVLVVVIRYFGGTKLGIPGLIHAYRTTASDTLDRNRIIKKYIPLRVTLFFSYEVMNEVMKMVKNLKLKIIEQRFETDCQLIAEARLSQKSSILLAMQPFPEIRVSF